MLTKVRLFLIFVVLGLALVFQNCGFKSFGNGEPYEGIVATLTGGTTPPPQGFPLALVSKTCEAIAANDVIKKAYIGKSNANDDSLYMIGPSLTAQVAWNAASNRFDAQLDQAPLIEANYKVILFSLNADGSASAVLDDGSSQLFQTLICQ